MCFKKTINFKTINLKRNQKPIIGKNILTFGYNNVKLCVISILVESNIYDV